MHGTPAVAFSAGCRRKQAAPDSDRRAAADRQRAFWLRVRMDGVHEIGYPAIAKAQQLSAERLGVRVSEHANRWDINRPPQNTGNSNGDSWTELADGKREKLQQLAVENIAAEVRSSLSPYDRSRPATANSRGVGDCLRRDKPVSPLPPRHDRRAQRTLSADITQVRMLYRLRIKR